MASSPGTVHELDAGQRSRPEVLVVDDRPTTRSLLRSVLEDAGYRVFEAVDGHDALAHIEARLPDVVLLDIIMPDLDGLETLRRIRRQWDEIELPVIMLTVKDTLSDIVATLEIGATDFLSKPINFPILLARLNRHLQRKKLADQIQQMRDTLEQKVEFRTKQLAEQGRALERSLDELRASEHRYSSFYNDTPALFMTVDDNGMLHSINRYGAELLGRKSEDVVGTPVRTLLHPNQSRKLASFLARLGEREDAVVRQELLVHTASGQHTWIRFSGRNVRRSSGESELLLSGEDVSESYQLAERLSYLSGHDELTGLFNRIELMRRIETAIVNGAREGRSHALFLLDIDQFRVVNDTHGHVAGDRYLCALARRLGSLLGPSDTVARIGGDEFAVLLVGVGAADARSLAERIRASIESLRVDFDGQRIAAAASIGVVPIESGAASVTEIMTRADAACYGAKKNGGNGVHLYKSDDESLERHYGEARWAVRIRDALDSEQFEFFAQEIVAAGVEPAPGPEHLELLVRVRRQEGGYLPNDQMIAAVEEYHHGLRLDTWVVEHAFRQLAEYGVRDGHPFGFNINVSGQSLGQVAFTTHVLEQFRRYGIPPELICFEITETAAIGNMDKAHAFFDAMRRLGCRLALDDFGSGLSSYGYLKRIPADILKIDGALVSDVETDEVKHAIVESIIRLAQKLSKRTIGEHVERAATRDCLTRLGIDSLQ